ncbi:hypothetical protein WN55_04226 [Dufourea novaeangliae]|uniref:Uncharacterized protein n=1 Tax=Dufourea novaeangliae TaxID=178035 RepID=A0A154NY16_DUFNO|nr:hypothetical protein WN55_04226 [Dufourea novaeangliae]
MNAAAQLARRTLKNVWRTRKYAAHTVEVRLRIESSARTLTSSGMVAGSFSRSRTSTAETSAQAPSYGVNLRSIENRRDKSVGVHSDRDRRTA